MKSNNLHRSYLNYENIISINRFTGARVLIRLLFFTNFIKENIMQSLKQVLMNRDKLTEAEAEEFINEARERIYSGDDPEEILLEEFGLEPDYVFDLL